MRARAHPPVPASSGCGERAEPNLDSSLDNRYKCPTYNRTGNNSEGQRLRRARSHPSYESAVCNLHILSQTNGPIMVWKALLP